MNTIYSDFKFFIEYDPNPFLIFSSNGKIKYLNESAEIIIKSKNLKQLFDLCIKYAPKTYGAKKTILDLEVETYEFFAINVSYQNDDEIALCLYLRPNTNKKNIVNFEGFSTTDINLLLQANIEVFKLQYKDVDIYLFCDYDIPPFLIDQNSFSLLLKKIFKSLSILNKIDISLKLKIGEKIKINYKQYNIIILSFKYEQNIYIELDTLKELSNKNSINLYSKNNTIFLEIPLIN